MARTACPLCGCREVDAEARVPFLVCTGCGELLTAAERVRHATRRARLRYNAANGHSPGYPVTADN